MFACIVLSNRDLLPSGWSPLKGFAFTFMQTEEDSYVNVREAWAIASSEERAGLWEDYWTSRLVDFARESSWLLMLICLAMLAYYVIYYVYDLLLEPVVEPFVHL